MTGTILLVDDDAGVLGTFRAWLQLEGCQVRTASNGEAALAQLGGVDAIVLDVRMPVLDGLGFLRRLRALDARMPVVVVTGDYLIEQPVLDEIERLGARLMFKPLWLDDLIALAGEMIGQTVPV